MLADNFYRKWAGWYTNETYLKKIYAIALVEGKDDKLFWMQIFNHAQVNVKLLSGSDNSEDNTSGKQQCLKYIPYLNKRFWICIDSDYDYVKQEQPLYNAAKFVLQTYTYSIENHYLASEEKAQGFLKKYSNIVYNAFLIHLAKGEPANAFCNLVAPDNMKETALEDLRKKVERYPDTINGYAESGLNADNVYLFMKAKILMNKAGTRYGDTLSFSHFPMDKILEDLEGIKSLRKDDTNNR